MKGLAVYCGGTALYLALALCLSLLFDPWSAPPPRSQQRRDHTELVSGDPTLTNPSAKGLSASSVRGAATSVSDYKLSQPYTHQNLTVYFILGPETLPSSTILTLDEAMEAGVAVVHDGSDQAIENLSSGEEIYVQAGDIIKGGKQDRALRYDAMISPLAQSVPLAVWCVERGRSVPRGREPGDRFSRSRFGLGISDLRRAACSVRAEQGDVWEAVEQTQGLLERKCGRAVREASRSSLQLTLESAPVRKLVEPYAAALGQAVLEQETAIGCVALVNGRAVLADVYASRLLFRKLWPKLLEGVAVEAVIDAKPGQLREPDEGTARGFLFDPEHAEPSATVTTNRIRVQEWRTDRAILLEYWDCSRDNLVLHRSFIAR
jgi:hypothetical protein